MDEQLKELVLARAAELTPTTHVQYEFDQGLIEEKTGGMYTIMGHGFKLEFSTYRPSDNLVWPLAATVLKVQLPAPPSSDEMRDYCTKWCEAHEEQPDSANWCSAKPQHADRPKAWHICSTFFSATDSSDQQVQLLYAVIRAIERGEIQG